MPRITRPQRNDLSAGVVLGVESVPDGLASGVLAGVNPVFGLYAYMVGTFAGALATSSVFMSVQATGAMAVIVADVPQVTSGPDAARSLFTLSVLTGLIMLALGLARAGTLTRFVPNSVLVGFVNAVALNIVLGQLANFTGYTSDAPNRLLRAIDTALHPGAFNPPTVLVGVLTIGMIVLLERTRLGALGMVVAVVAASAVAALPAMSSVKVLDDIAPIPGSLPAPVLPSPSLAAGLLVPALSLALVGLVQGAAISGSLPNPDGRYPDPSGDFRGQGVANIASGLFQGMPVGGSMSATSLVTGAGARTRWANLVAGVVMAVVVLVAGDLVGYIAMPAVAALLIVVGVRSFKPAAAAMVWRTGYVQAAVMVVTFGLTVLIPLQYAVLAGVGLTVLVQLVQQSNRVTVTRWVLDEAGRHEEVTPPEVLPAGETVVLQAYGNLFFASAPVFEAQLPRVEPTSTGTAVVLRLRGEQELGSTFIKVVDRYNAELQAVGSRLLLAGVGPQVSSQLDATGVAERLGPHSVFAATPRVTESLARAVDEAGRWQKP